MIRMPADLPIIVQVYKDHTYLEAEYIGRDGSTTLKKDKAAQFSTQEEAGAAIATHEMCGRALYRMTPFLRMDQDGRPREDDNKKVMAWQRAMSLARIWNAREGRWERP